MLLSYRSWKPLMYLLYNYNMRVKVIGQCPMIQVMRIVCYILWHTHEVMYSGILLFSVIYIGIPSVTHCGILFFQWCKVAYYFKLVHGVFEVLIILLLLFMFLFTLKSTSAPSVCVCLLLQPADSLLFSLAVFSSYVFPLFLKFCCVQAEPCPPKLAPFVLYLLLFILLVSTSEC